MNAMTGANDKLLCASASIYACSPSSDEWAFLHAVLCQVGLPRSRIAGNEFMRQSGDAWVNVQAGWLDEGRGPVRQTVPYGTMPRLALAWISTTAVKQRQREIHIGDSASEFLKAMGMGDEGKRYATLRKQMHALAACRLQLGCKGRTFSGQPIEQFDAWIDNRDSGQRALWPGALVLSDRYYDSLIESAVPLDKRALLALKGSSLALDIYAWLAHRLHRVGSKVTLQWSVLRAQFGQEYKGKDPDKDFRREFLQALNKVLTVYPAAKVEVVTGGLSLRSSPPPVKLKTQFSLPAKPPPQKRPRP